MNGFWLIQLVFTQTLQVTLLAGIVLTLTKFFAKDRPHLAHSLWALVVLKCLMPPIIASPTSVFSWLFNGYAAVANSAQSPTEIERSLNTVPHAGLAPVIVRVSPDSYASDGFETQAALPSKNRIATRHNGSALVVIALYLWIAIAALVFVISALRLWIFMRRVEKKTLPTSPSLNALVKSVSKRIGLHRTVQIRTVDAAIGPAVVGLIWPTILLPKMIVDGRADAELEPLLAHELIHIRRGDLVWAMLQGLSVSPWWFNPFVWIAERLLTREAERSCDEETIAGLGCSPAMYARSLLDVMERKHELRAAPSLPGVRPVDITAKRLERIMRLGHGCYRQRPWWVVVVWLIGCAIALPGAAWVVAQEKPKQEPSVFKEAGFGSVTNSQPIRLPRAAAGGPVVAETQIEVKSFQVADVVDRLCKERNLVKSEAEKELIRILQLDVPVINIENFEDRITSELENAEITGHSAATDETSQFSELSLEECIAISLKNVGKRFFSATIVGEHLHASATVDQVKQIERSIEHFRKFGFRKVITKIDSYEIPRVMTVDDQGELVAADKLKSQQSGSEGSKPGLSDEVKPGFKIVVLESSNIAKLRHAIKNDGSKDIVRVSSPNVTAFSGQQATIQTGDLRDYTIAYKPVNVGDGEVNFEPVVLKIQTGFCCDVRATLKESASEADVHQMAINLNVSYTELKAVTKLTSKFLEPEREFAIEFPCTKSHCVNTELELTADQTLVVVQTFEEKTVVTFVHCKPIEENHSISPVSDVCVNDWLQPDMGLRVAIPAMGPIPVTLDFTPRSQKVDGERTQVFSFFMGFTR